MLLLKQRKNLVTFASMVLTGPILLRRSRYALGLKLEMAVSNLRTRLETEEA